MLTCGELSFVSNVFSTLSLGSWVCAQMPQIVTNYKNKSAEGISPLFLGLWFMGDFLSFVSCLLNDVVLKFQVYLSLFFICNDIVLCFQYYYYNNVYPEKYALVNGNYSDQDDEDSNTNGVQNNTTTESEFNPSSSIHIRHHHAPDNTLFEPNPWTKKSSPNKNSPSTNSSGSPGYNSTSDNNHLVLKTAAASSMVALSNALPILFNRDNEISTSSYDSLGIFLAWCCTFVYMSSRCPQIYKNYTRKSVEGINSLLFGAALLGNLTYTFSILTSCEFIYDDAKTDFFMRELPYILGSSGTVIFDFFYFYQKYIYRNNSLNPTVINLESWPENSNGESSHLVP